MKKASIQKGILLLTVVAALVAIWFFTPLPTIAARHAWHRYGLAYPALLLNRGDAELSMQLGSYYFNGTAGRSEYDLSKAGCAFRKAVSISPDIMWGHYQLARIYFVEGDSHKALEEINLELVHNPENLRALYVRGLIYGFEGNLVAAEADFERFTEWAPSEWAGHNDYAWILSLEGKFSQAEAALKTAFTKVSNADTNPWLWNALGLAQLNQKKYASARASFERAQSLADKLTTADWIRAYSGNDPKAAQSGVDAFLAVIRDNLARAMAGDTG